MRNFALFTSVLIVFASCDKNPKPSSESDVLHARIDSLEAIVFADSDEPSDKKASLELVRSYARFYENNKNDSIAVDMLFKAGEVSMGLGRGKLAVKYFTIISNNHKEFHKTPEATFLTGFCQENLNNDTTAARFCYEKFIETYPNHRLANDAKFSIQNMSMSDEELIRLFQSKNKVES